MKMMIFIHVYKICTIQFIRTYAVIAYFRAFQRFINRFKLVKRNYHGAMRKYLIIKNIRTILS
jgi:hypothetical protein